MLLFGQIRTSYIPVHSIEPSRYATSHFPWVLMLCAVRLACSEANPDARGPERTAEGGLIGKLTARARRRGTTWRRQMVENGGGAR